MDHNNERDFQLLRQAESFMRQHQMTEPGSHVIAGVSGGADSICMLLVLLHLRDVFKYEVSVVHVEHGIRGEAAHKDAAFVSSFCRASGIECHIRHFQVLEYARAHGMSEEEAGRCLRYQAFAEEKKRFCGKMVRIAVAHNLEDHAETMLFHLARGTGIQGLASIAPVRGDIIRPLLQVSRVQIETYLSQVGQTFCTDATNASDAYSRNQIRHQILPVLLDVNDRAPEHMYQTAQQLREIDGYLKKQAYEARKICCTMRTEGVEIEKESFLRLEPVIQKELLRGLLGTLAGSGKDLTREHVRQLLELFEKQNGRQIQLPYRMKAVRVYSGVEIRRIKNVENAVNRPEEHTDDLQKQFSFRIIDDISEHMSQISKKKYTKCFDYDKIKHGFCVRNRQPGDYLAINASGGCQKLKKYLVNEKIPAEERERLLLLADGAHIMWIVGYRISSYYKVDGQTRRILEVTFCGGREDEGTNSGNDFRGRSKGTNCRDCCTD